MAVVRDESIVKDVVDSLYWDSRVDASKVSVTVDDGIVKLAGSVPSYTSREAASEDAWLITGVRQVDNQLKVDYQVEIPSDREIASNIGNLFMGTTISFPMIFKLMQWGGG